MWSPLFTPEAAFCIPCLVISWLERHRSHRAGMCICMCVYVQLFMSAHVWVVYCVCVHACAPMCVYLLIISANLWATWSLEATFTPYVSTPIHVHQGLCFPLFKQSMFEAMESQLWEWKGGNYSCKKIYEGNMELRKCHGDLWWVIQR